MKKILSVLLVIAIFISAASITAFAGSVYVSTGALNLTKGSSGSFSITASDAAGRVDIYSSDPGVATVSSSSAWVENGSVGVTVNAVSAGTAVITVNYSDCAGFDGNVISGASSITVTVSEPSVAQPKAAESNSTTLEEEDKDPIIANLSKMDVLLPLIITPEFKADVYEYSVTVPKGVNAINISALVDEEFKGAKVAVKGADDLNASGNKVVIEVTAEDGNVTTYTINVSFEEETEEKVVVPEKTRIPVWVVIVLSVAMIVFCVLGFFLGRKNKKETEESNIEIEKAENE